MTIEGIVAMILGFGILIVVAVGTIRLRHRR